MNEEKRDWKQVFLERLENLTSGEKAALKRCIGLQLKDSRNEAIAAFYKTIPFNEIKMGREFEEKLFLLATLRAFHRYPEKKEISFGTTLRLLKEAQGSKSFDKKFYALIDSKISPDDGELAYRMAQIIRMSDSHGIKIFWRKLLDDLIVWGSETKTVQRNWARSYFVAGEDLIKKGEKKYE